MHITKFAILLATGLSGALARLEGHARRDAPQNSTGLLDVLRTPLNNIFSTEGFGGRTPPSGEGATYRGNVGSPWGSNIKQVDADKAFQYKYFLELRGSGRTDLYVKVWNKYAPDGTMSSWFEKWAGQCLTVFVAKGTSVYLAVDDDTQGGLTLSPTKEFPVNGGWMYASTYGEFDFGSDINGGYSGADVSIIQAQNPEVSQTNTHILGMLVSDALSKDGQRSSVTENGANLDNAWTWDTRDRPDLGLKFGPGPRRLVFELDWQG